MTQQEVEPGVQTFTATTLRRALNDVRRTIGADALILSQRKIGDRVVVRACLEAPPERSSIELDAVAEPATAQPAQRAEEFGAESARQQSADQITDPGTDADETSDKVSSAAATSQPEEDRLIDQTRIAAAAAIDAADRAGPALNFVDSTVPAVTAATPACLDDLEYFGEPIANLRGCYRLLGSSGAGKTATVIKLMIDWVRVHGAGTLQVISTDTSKLAGRESLALACQSLQVNLLELSQKEVPAYVRQTNGAYRLVLVDTAGSEDTFNSASASDIKNILVCSSQHSRHALGGSYSRLAHLGLSGVAITQLDLPGDGLGLVAMLRTWQLPVFWMGTSASLPQGLEVAGASRLAECLFSSDIQFTGQHRVKKLTDEAGDGLRASA